MIKKLTFTIILILSFGIISCFMPNSFKLKIDSYEYVITANNINDTFKAIIDNNIYEMTPLIYASFSGNVPLAKFSIKSKADINAKDENGSTALIVATTNGNLEIIKYLSQERGLEVNAQDDIGLTALMYAAESGNLEIVKYLIDERRADFNIKEDNQGHDAFILAILYGHLEVVKYFVEEKRLDINAKDNEGWTAFMHAPAMGHLEVSQYLLEKGADIDAKDNNGVTSLMHASNNGHSKMVKYLVEFESRINSLYDAIKENNPKKIIDIANNYKIDLNNILFKDIESVFGTMETIPLDMTPLIYAIDCGNIEAIDTLLRLGANIGQLTDIHFTYFTGGLISITPLMYAAASDSTGEIISFLIKKGAKVNAKNREGKTALMYSCPYRYEPSNYANIDSAKALINSGADVNAKDKDGKTALMYATYDYDKELTDLFLRSRANVNAKDNNGMTVLMYACYDDSDWGSLNPDIIKSLIRARANINEIDKDGDSALLYAIYTYKGTAYLNFASDEEELNENTLSTFETIRFLIYNGANVNIRNKKGETPLSLSKGYPKLTKLLKDNGAY